MCAATSSDFPAGSYMGNGNQWADSARRLGYWVDSTPRQGDVMVFQSGQAGSSLIYGHVAIVEQVNEDGSIVTSEWRAAYNGQPFSRTFPASEVGDYQYNPLLIKEGVMSKTIKGTLLAYCWRRSPSGARTNCSGCERIMPEIILRVILPIAGIIACALGSTLMVMPAPQDPRAKASTGSSMRKRWAGAGIVLAGFIAIALSSIH